MAEARRNFAIACRFVDSETFVFLDESGAKTNMTRLYGRSSGGSRCVDKTPHGHWKTITMLSAICHAGVIEGASMAMDGPIDGPTFLGYVEQCLVPSLVPGQIIVMDNLASHKIAGVREAIEAAGCDLWYLPAYSPDLNPIEKLWSKVKSWLRRAAAKTFETVVDAIGLALRSVSNIECRNYFTSCGYKK